MTAASHQQLDSVIRQIHLMVGNESRWNEILSQIRVLLDVRSAALAKHDFLTGRGEQLFESPPDPSLRSEYSREHSVRNPWFMSSMDYRTGRIMTGEELLDPADLVRTDFYQRFLKHHDFFHWLCGVLVCRNDVVLYISLHRAKGQTAFDECDKKLLTPILDHLQISLENHWALLSARSANRVLREVSDRLNSALFVVERDGRVLFQNNESEKFLKRCVGLQIVESRIIAVSDEENRALGKAISEAAVSSMSETGRVEKTITLGGIGLTHPLIISIRSAGKLYCEETCEYKDVAIVCAKNPDETQNQEVCSFSKIYQLTPAQARLTSLILSGHSCTQAARQLNVSENTVRSHLKQIYLKTNTHGQMELVHLHAKTCTDHY